MPANLETHQWLQDWERSVFLPIPKKSNAKECSNYHIMAHISHASKVMLKIFQVSLQEYVNHELQMFKLDLEKAEELEMGIPDHLTCLRRNLYTGQEATVRTGYGTIDWFQIRKGVHQGYKLSPCLFYLYAEDIMRNARLDEAQAGIKIARRNISNLRYADNTIMTAEIEELKNL